MSQPRFEIYINVHKGLRYLFGQILCQAGRIDYSTDTDVDKFAVQRDELTTYLKDHADNEEECVLKPLEQRAPDAIKRDLEVMYHRIPLPDDVAQSSVQFAGSRIACFEGVGP